MSLITEFKKFAMRGNVMDLAVGVIIGASFTGIVNSLVNDVIMPPIGLALGGVDFANFFVVLKGDRAVDTLAAAKAAKDVTINYGLFINAMHQFPDRGLCPVPADPPDEQAGGAHARRPKPRRRRRRILLLREIRDSLKIARMKARPVLPPCCCWRSRPLARRRRR